MARVAPAGDRGQPGRALRHQRVAGAVRNPGKAGRVVLWEVVK